jgi:cytochrome P450
MPELRRDPIGTFVKVWRQYGDVVHLWLGGPYNGYLLAHPDHVKHVLQDANRNYPKHPYNISKLKSTLGEGLLTSHGDYWLRQRRLMQPAFHRQRLTSLGTMMTDATLAMLAGWEKRPDRSAYFDVASELMHLTLTIIARAMFSADVTSVVGDVERSVAVTLADSMRRTQSYVDIPRWVPTHNNRAWLNARGVLDAIVYRFIGERRRSGIQRDDLLTMLLETRDEDTGESMTDEQIRDEVMTIFIAGHETTAVNLTWTFFLLSRHPESNRRLKDELDRVLGGRPPTVADLANLPYLRMVVDESMRLYPPAWALSRLPLVDDEIGGFHIPPRVNVFLSPYVTHRHPEFWENPEGFDPERFSPGRSAGRPRYAFFPFGGGPRMCIGNNFALMEAQLILATIAQRYRLDLAPGYVPFLKPMITLRARDGMPMRVRNA